MALSGAAAAGAASSALGGTVQITQVNNQFSSSADNLKADLTGDGVPDLIGLDGRTIKGTVVDYLASTWQYRNRVGGTCIAGSK